jgi:hypothetical protein
MTWTRTDGWVWVFALLDHYSDEAWAQPDLYGLNPVLPIRDK